MDLQFPQTDPTPIFDHFRSLHATEVLTAAVAHLGLFHHFDAGPVAPSDLRSILHLAERPFVVLTVALRAMELLERTGSGDFDLTPLAREHLVSGAPFDVSGYLGLGANNPSVLGLVERLRTNRPTGAHTHSSGDPGTTHIYRHGVPSALDQPHSARESTLCLAGRARNVAPYLAMRTDLSGVDTLLDVGGGSGIYAYALLRRHPTLKAIVLDRPAVLTVAEECAREWDVQDRVTFAPADLLDGKYPAADVVMFSNVLHDWDTPDVERLVRYGAEALPTGGRLLIHDVFLDDTMDGPLPLALYSVLLFSLTEGRAYSGAEYGSWLRTAGLTPQPIVPTFVRCGVLAGIKA